MIKVKTTNRQLPYYCSFFGGGYMCSIGKTTANRLVKVLPGMGYEIVVSHIKNDMGFFDQLLLQNISGTYYLASSSVLIANWVKVFGITIVGRD